MLTCLLQGMGMEHVLVQDTKPFCFRNQLAVQAALHLFIVQAMVLFLFKDHSGCVPLSACVYASGFWSINSISFHNFHPNNKHGVHTDTHSTFQRPLSL